MLLGHKDVSFLFVALFFIVIATAVLAVALSPCMVYGKIHSDLFLNALVADNVHAVEFITTLPAKLFVSVTFVLAVTWALIGLRNHLIVKARTWRVLAVIFFGHLLLSRPIETCVKSWLKKPDNQFSLTDIVYKNRNFLVRDIANVHVAYEEALAELAKQAQVLNAEPDWEPEVVASEFDNYVVVIGESVRRDALHAYGFNIENTPFLSDEPRVQFNHYISDGGHTVVSLSNMLMLDCHVDHHAGNNIVDLANLAGFETYWLSNQNELGIRDSIVGGIVKKSAHHYFLHAAGGENVIQDDALLLPHIAAALDDEGKAKKIIFVHLYGSNMNFCKRVNGRYEVFHVSEKLSCYIQSIKQTDHLLKQIHTQLKQDKEHNNKEWAMVYFSDHGLAANDADKTIRHGEECKENYEVPFVVLNSKLTKTTYINAQRSALNFFDFFSAWTGIKDDHLPHECSFISEDPCLNSHTVVRHNNEEMDYFKLKNEKVNFFRS